MLERVALGLVDIQESQGVDGIEGQAHGVRQLELDPPPPATDRSNFDLSSAPSSSQLWVVFTLVPLEGRHGGRFAGHLQRQCGPAKQVCRDPVTGQWQAQRAEPRHFEIVGLQRDVGAQARLGPSPTSPPSGSSCRPAGIPGSPISAS